MPMRFLLHCTMLFMLSSIFLKAQDQVRIIPGDALQERINYADLFCDRIHVAQDEGKTMDRSLLNSKENFVLAKWIEGDGYSTKGHSISYLTLKLQYETFKSCEAYRALSPMVFLRAKHDDVEEMSKHKDAFEFLAAFENGEDIIAYMPDEETHKQTFQFQQKVNELTDRLYIQIAEDRQYYQVKYFPFDPMSETFPLEHGLIVMTLEFNIDDKMISNIGLMENQDAYETLKAKSLTDNERQAPEEEPMPAPASGDE